MPDLLQQWRLNDGLLFMSGLLVQFFRQTSLAANHANILKSILRGQLAEDMHVQRLDSDGDSLPLE